MAEALHWTDFGVNFWVQIAVGMGAFLISGWVWSLRAQNLATRLFFLSGVSTLIFTFSAAIYTTRELALPATLFKTLTACNAFGASLFGISMLALFLVYPANVPRWRMWVAIEAGFFGLWTLLSLMGVLPAWMGVNLVTLCEMIGILMAIVVQFFCTRGQPQQRAALTWLGMSVLIGAGAFITLNALPLVLDLKVVVEQAYAFLFFLVIYLGLAAGLRSYRLFEVGSWAYRLLFYLVGTVLLVLLDLAFVSWIGLGRFPAMGLSLMAVGFLYLPFRDLLGRFFSKRKSLQVHELLADAPHVALSPSAGQSEERWKKLLQKLFDPLEIKTLRPAAKDVRIVDNGLGLVLPPVMNAPSLFLNYPWSGRSLFSLQAKELAAQVISLVEKAKASREAYDQGVAEERRRVTQDLHDDIGARLLSGLYASDEKHKPLFKEALADVRAMVSDMTQEEVALERLLADMRHETQQRLAAANMQLHWSLSEHPALAVPSRQQKALRSAMREVVSNAIRHSGATQLDIHFEKQGNELCFMIADNGRGISEAVLRGQGAGHGLNNLRKRMEELQGSVHFAGQAQGTQIKIKVPY